VGEAAGPTHGHKIGHKMGAIQGSSARTGRDRADAGRGVAGPAGAAKWLVDGQVRHWVLGLGRQSPTGYGRSGPRLGSAR
jgi:hypothetical protein